MGSPANFPPVIPAGVWWRDMAIDLMSREVVAELLGIDIESVRTILKREGIHEHRGYPSDEVLALHRRRSQPQRKT